MLGALLAASFYVAGASFDQGQIISFHAMWVGSALGFLAIPAFTLALNIRRPTLATLMASFVLAPLVSGAVMLISVRLPGSEWTTPELLRWLAAIPALSTLVFAVKVPRAIPGLLLSCTACLLTGIFAVHVVTQRLLQQQIERTLGEGGCVLAGAQAKRRIGSIDEIDVTLIPGEPSDPVFFVDGDRYRVWSYSAFGLDSRKGEPIRRPLTEGMNCGVI